MKANVTYNFCAGPAALPQSVMRRARQEFLDWKGLGVSVMEVSHRSAEFQELAMGAESNLRQLLSIDDDYAVLFLHGGGTLQFSTIPMALLDGAQQAEYLLSGIWSKKAAKEAMRFGQVHQVDLLKTDEINNYALVEPDSGERIQSPAYTHFTPNETIGGIRFDKIPAGDAPLIADLSSCILSEQINVSNFDLIYAGAQKNIGSAGMCVVIVKRALFDKMNFKHVPAVSNYEAQAGHFSMLNTPPTYAWYLASLVFEWLLAEGGVACMEQKAIEKSQLLYQCIDEDDFYQNSVVLKNRSRMNVPFRLKNEQLNLTFIHEAKEAGLIGLEGHRSAGGMRASLYNSMPLDGARALTQFMREFKAAYG